jgi:hypothetical protein
LSRALAAIRKQSSSSPASSRRQDPPQSDPLPQTPATSPAASGRSFERPAPCRKRRHIHPLLDKGAAAAAVPRDRAARSPGMRGGRARVTDPSREAGVLAPQSPEGARRSAPPPLTPTPR